MHINEKGRLLASLFHCSYMLLFTNSKTHVLNDTALIDT
jgi:hypothetical protein